MHSLFRKAGVALLLASAAFAQDKPATLAFEVASIKPAGPLNPQAIMSGQMRIGMKVDQARVDIGSFSLSDLIRTAYRLKTYQVTGPDWLGNERFNVLGKMPAGTTEEQVPEMLQALLAERFKLTFHKENKDHSIYALVIGKGGHKMKDAEPDPVPAADASGEPGAKPASANEGQIKISGGPQDMLSGGRGMVVQGGQAGGGATRMTMTPQGTMHMEASKMSMPILVEALTRFVDRPVVDMTDLKGNYQVAVELSLDDMRAVARSAGMMIPGAGAGAGPAAAGAAAALGVAGDPSGSIFASVQALGLKLEARKNPIEVLVVDHVEKMPTEN